MWPISWRRTEVSKPSLGEIRGVLAHVTAAYGTSAWIAASTSSVLWVVSDMSESSAPFHEAEEAFTKTSATSPAY